MFRLTLLRAFALAPLWIACSSPKLEKRPDAAEATLHSLMSPDGALRIDFGLRKGVPFYTLSREGQVLVGPSPLGLRMRRGVALDQGLKVHSVDYRDHDERWEQPWGEQRIVRDRHRQMRVELSSAAHPQKGAVLGLVFRSFDDGIAFRYELPELEGEASFELEEEKTEFHIPEAKYAWWIPAGKIKRYEYLFRKTSLDALSAVHTPLTIELEEGILLSLHEAALVDYAAMYLARGSVAQTLEAKLFAWKDGVKVRASRPHRSPWRTIQVATRAPELIQSTMILNLNEANALGDVSWARPQKYVGIWWGMHLGKNTWGSGAKHGATTKNAMRLIDFAAEQGIPAMLVEGWNLGWDGDWMKHPQDFVFDRPYPDFDIEKVVAYGRERGVQLIGHHETGGALANYEAQMERAFAYYANLGVRTVKTGYVDEVVPLPEHHHGQFMVRHFQKVAEVAARHRIALNVHEPIKDTGLRRTYPNMLSREGARGTEYDAWSEDGGNPPEHTAILPFTRCLAGPLDYTPGIFKLRFNGNKARNRVRTTLAKQLALYVVIYSPLQMVADLPENYRAKRAFQFIKDVPVDWEKSLALEGAIGDYVTIARQERGSDHWYVGSLSGGKARTMDLALDFLAPNRRYRAEIYRDASDADWERRPEAIALETREVRASDRLKVAIAAGGGCALRFVALPPGE